MPIKTSSFPKIRSVFFFSLITILGLAMLYLFRPFFYPIFWAAIIAVLFYPLYQFFLKHFKFRSLSSIITILLVIIILVLPLSVLSTLLINKSIDLYQTVSNSGLVEKVDNVSHWLSQNTTLAPYLTEAQIQWPQYANDFTKSTSIFLFDNLKNITQNSLMLLGMFLLMLYCLFFFFKDGSRILKQLMHLSPLGDNYEKMLYDRFISATRATLKGVLLVGSVQGILGGIIFWITGVEGALVWAVIMVCCAIIPIFGVATIWFPAGIIMLITGNIWQGLTILLFGIFVISTIDNIIRPLIVGKDIQIHPLLVLFSTLGGLILFGISGFIIGPVIASLFLAVMSIYEHHYKNELGEN